MNLSVKTNQTRYEKGRIRNAVSFALNSATLKARQRFEHYAGICKTFEKKIQADFGQVHRAIRRGQTR
jgi:hypothetical protein